jgi:osmotically-inducible protein OsmY
VPKIIPSDADIQRNVLDELDWDPEVEAPDVGVEVDDGVITLNGTVANSTIKVAAERAAQRVHGVRAVANDIVVRALGTGERSDTDIALAIADGLEWSDVVPEGQLQVTVDDGIVTLRGTVSWRYEAVEAAELARKVKGVSDVVNEIAVDSPENLDDTDIQTEIERALERNAELDAEHIEVELMDSIVTLRGVVGSWSEREEAERVAWRSPAITRVTNELRIAP